MQKLIAMWNTVRGVWEKPETGNLFCEHWEPFSETWPTSGSMRSGQVFERPTPERRTIDSEFSSLLRTPTAAEVEGGPVSPEVAKAKGQTLRLTGQVLAMKPAMLPTVMVSDLYTDNMKSTQQKEGSMHSVTLSQAVHMLPTPEAYLGNPKKGGSADPDKRRKGGHSVSLADEIEKGKDWGKFEAAIRRWEFVLGRSAPEPTLPDGQKGQHRLSSRFTEWMMGLNDGWITGHGLHRKDEIKMAGNGVVPQQAEYALKILLNRLGD